MKDATIGVVGLGYVGLPLAVAFGHHARTIGYDIAEGKVEQIRKHRDPTGEVDEAALRAATRLEVVTDAARLSECNFIVVAVPTPVDAARKPDFGPLESACRAVGPFLRPGAVVVFESTVYPGATEEVCVPALEKASGKKWKEHFFVGYSPERINPGDPEHTLEKIVKVVAGDTSRTLEAVAALYDRVVKAGIHRASSIRVAEAAKVIENTQRDLNIALMNELAVIFHRMGIDTQEVLEAAGTKWNFLRFRPGLVGGHCIGVDPYYLTYQAERHGHHPQVILSGRRINDDMSRYVAREAVKCLAASGHPVNGAKVAVLGLTFKQNCPDLRNSKVADLIDELASFGAKPLVHDPRANAEEARHEYGIDLVAWDDIPACDALVLAVAHSEYVGMSLDALLSRVQPGGCVVDIMSALDRAEVERRGYRFWRL